MPIQRLMARERATGRQSLYTSFFATHCQAIATGEQSPQRHTSHNRFTVSATKTRLGPTRLSPYKTLWQKTASRSRAVPFRPRTRESRRKGQL